jgi:hypothetical protein
MTYGETREESVSGTGKLAVSSKHTGLGPEDL